MWVKAKFTIKETTGKGASKKTEYKLGGSTFETSDARGKKLIDDGLAVEADAPVEEELQDESKNPKNPKKSKEPTDKEVIEQAKALGIDTEDKTIDQIKGEMSAQ